MIIQTLVQSAGAGAIGETRYSDVIRHEYGVAQASSAGPFSARLQGRLSDQMDWVDIVTLDETTPISQVVHTREVRAVVDSGTGVTVELQR